MGCSWSSNTDVEPLRPEDVKGAEDETGTKLDGRGDSAISKGTTDSGVEIEDGHVPALPGEVPRKPTNLKGVTDGAGNRNRQDDIQLQSSEILEELENEGIIPVGQRGSAAGQAYSIMLDDGEAVRRRPPARLESLKATREQSLPSREKCEEKMRLVEERRKFRENELKTRLRAKSARVRVPAPTNISEADVDTTVAPVAWTDQCVSAVSFGQIERGETEGEEHVGESLHNVRERREEGGTEGSQGGRENSDGEVEELTQVVDLMNVLCDSR